MPQDKLQFNTPLVVMIANCTQRVTYIHKDMQKFLDHPVEECIGRGLASVVQEVTKERISLSFEDVKEEVIFSFQGQSCCLSIQWILTGEEYEGAVVLLHVAGEEEKRTVYRFASVLNCGLCILRRDGDWKISSANEACYALFGYKQEQFATECGADPMSLVDPEDCEEVRGKIRACIVSGGPYLNLQARCRKRDGTQIWVEDRVTLLQEQDSDVLVCLLWNITEKKRLEQEIERTAKRYRQVLIGDALASYEVDLDNDVFLETLGKTDKGMFTFVGLTAESKYSEFVKCWAEKNVHHEDQARFRRELAPEYLRRRYGEGSQEVVCEYRSNIVTGRMIWCSTTVYMIRSGGHLSGFVYVKNIQEKKQKELELLKRSRIDSLTGLLNRTACVHEINGILAHGGSSALLMIDVDNFKAVNDTYGHMFGDTVLTGIAYKLKLIFDNGEILGRLGGDEFLVFIKNVTDDSEVFAKARIVATELQNIQKDETVDLNISNSIGIAFSPRHGTSFQELYEKADTALRYAKNAGKSCYSVFGSKVCEVLPLEYTNREWLLDELEEIVYVSDLQDYTLYYVNRAGRKLTGLRLEDFGKSKCYKVLQGLDTPCPFCTNAKLNRDGFYVWEYENTHLHKNFIVKDKLVEWDGKQVRMEIAVDVGDRIRGDANITSKYHMETVMLDSLRILNTADTLDEAINRTLELICRFYAGSRSYIIEIDREQCIARNTYEWCAEGASAQKSSLQNVPLDAIPYIFETFDKKQHLIIPQVEELRFSYPSEYRFLTTRDAHSLFAVPFEDREAFSGYIGVDNPNINHDTIRLLDSIAYNIANEIKKRRMYEQLQYDASHDTLSGLLNRASFVQTQEELRHGTYASCGVVTADINGLKLLNREFGHIKGDETIRRTADIMRNCFPNAKVFRLSGDEFVILAPGEDYETFMNRLDKMKWRFEEETPSGVSMGSTWSEGLTDIDMMMHHAEERMLVNKRTYYTNSEGARKHYSPEMVKDLVREMEHGYYQMYLQPKVDSVSGEIQSAEALARYQVPGERMLSPGRFVPVLEKETLIRYLDFFMLENVCRMIDRWQKEGRKLVPISVNFSRITLLGGDLLRELERIQKRYDIPYHMVMIEVTERVGDIERKVIEQIGLCLRKMGFRLSLDDFGADYANMLILSVVHFDEVKLDKSLIDNLVENETRQTVVRCIIEMCKSLQVNCVAEGVETREQLEVLKKFGCTSIQGYYYSRPVPVAKFEQIMAAGAGFTPEGESV